MNDHSKSITKHAHFWRIAPAEGPMSLGVCHCGAQQMFRNYCPTGDPVLQQKLHYQELDAARERVAERVP